MIIRVVNKVASIQKVFTAPDKWQNWQIQGKTKIFLGGSIEMGAAEEWQKVIIDSVEDIDNVVLFNPRRRLWDITANTSVIEEQIEWELAAQDIVDRCIYYIDPNTKSPITLMELGAFSGKTLAVCMPPGFYRADNVRVFCKHYKIPLLDSLDQLIGVIKYKLVYK